MAAAYEKHSKYTLAHAIHKEVSPWGQDTYTQILGCHALYLLYFFLSFSLSLFLSFSVFLFLFLSFPSVYQTLTGILKYLALIVHPLSSLAT